jgi:hypothetical protein
MTIQPIKNDMVLETQGNPQLNNAANPNTLIAKPSAQNKPHAPDSVPGKSTADSTAIASSSADAPDGIAASRLTTLQDDAANRTTLAKAVRVATEVDGQMEKMKRNISQIVNSYPPFLRGDEKRVEYLMSIASIREQIEAMTIPPDIATAESQGAAGRIWGDLFSGIKIPELITSGPQEATDEQLNAAAATITGMQAALFARRSGLQAEALPSANISAQEAGKTAISVRDAIAANGLPISTKLGEVLKNI